MAILVAPTNEASHKSTYRMADRANGARHRVAEPMPHLAYMLIIATRQ